MTAVGKVAIQQVILTLKFTYPLACSCLRIAVFYVTDVSIPMSWYTVDARNNTIDFKIKTGTGVTSVISPLQQAVITTGDYSIATLATDLQTQINLVVKRGTPSES